jgi:hypothetical protein
LHCACGAGFGVTAAGSALVAGSTAVFAGSTVFFAGSGVVFAVESVAALSSETDSVFTPELGWEPARLETSSLEPARSLSLSAGGTGLRVAVCAVTAAAEIIKRPIRTRKLTELARKRR